MTLQLKPCLRQSTNAGLALTQIKPDFTFSDDYLSSGGLADIAQINKPHGAGRWVVGGEYALSENWAIKAEYLYVDEYAKSSYLALNNTLKSAVELTTQLVTVGMTYRF